MGFFTALKFLTVFPVPSRYDGGTVQLGRSIAFFPVVGLVIGIVLSGLAFFLRTVFPQAVNAALLVATLAILTGAHHLDGLMDTCDGLTAGKTRAERLAIMSDTRVGAFGIAGACLILLLKFAALSGTAGIATMLVFPAASRWAMSGTILIFPSAREDGTGHAVKQGARWSGFIAGSVITLVICLLCLGPLEGLLLMAGLLALVCALGAMLTVIYGGLTGDCYGAIVEAGEVLALLLIFVISTHPYAFPGNALIIFP